ncbi:hypothetical protein ABT336_10240, partial [Micromonospora sp. NPDC000207]
SAARADADTAAARADDLTAQVEAARDAVAAAQARHADLEQRLRAAHADRDVAERRATQLADQVSNLASALARLGAPPPR